MNKNYYSDDYYNEKRNYYLFNKCDGDLYTSLLCAYGSACGVTLLENDGSEMLVLTFLGISFVFLGKGLYDLAKVAEIEYKRSKEMGMTEPLKLRRIKEYK